MPLPNVCNYWPGVGLVIIAQKRFFVSQKDCTHRCIPGDPEAEAKTYVQDNTVTEMEEEEENIF